MSRTFLEKKFLKLLRMYHRRVAAGTPVRSLLQLSNERWRLRQGFLAIEVMRRSWILDIMKEKPAGFAGRCDVGSKKIIQVFGLSI